MPRRLSEWLPIRFDRGSQGHCWLRSCCKCQKDIPCCVSGVFDGSWRCPEGIQFEGSLSSFQLWFIQPRSEFRFQVDVDKKMIIEVPLPFLSHACPFSSFLQFLSPCSCLAFTIQLRSGQAEYFGSELAPTKQYTISGSSGSVSYNGSL